MKKLIADILIGWAFSLDPSTFLENDLKESKKRISKLEKAIVEDDYCVLQTVKAEWEIRRKFEKALYFGERVIFSEENNILNAKNWIEDETINFSPIKEGERL